MNFLQQIILALSISLDNFVTAFGYGTQKIKISPFCFIILSIVNFISILLSCLFGGLIGRFLSKNITFFICFGLIMALGVYKFVSEVVKIYLNKIFQKSNVVFFKIFKFSFYLSVYADETRADVNNDKKLSFFESLLLGFILSLDCISVGLGAGLNHFPLFLVIFTSLFTLIFMPTGYLFGKIIARKTKINLSWLSGLILIILALFMLF